MSNAGDKKVTVSFGIDQRSLSAALGGIRQLTSELKTLVETMSRVHSGMQAIGGGGGLFGGMSTKGGGGAIGPAQQNAVRGGSIFTQGIAADARALAASTKMGADSLKGLASATKSSITEQIGNIQRLRQELKQLENSYDKLGGVNAAPGSRAASRLDSIRAEREFDIRNTRAQLQHAEATFEASRPDNGGFEEGGDGGGGGKKGGYFRYGGTGFKNVREAISRIPGAATFARGLGTGGMIAGATAMAYEYMNRMVVQRDATLANEALQAGMDDLRRRAQISQAYGQIGYGARRDVNTGLAVRQLTATELRGAIGDEAFKALVTQAYQNSKSTGGFKQGVADVKERISNVMTDLLGSNEGIANDKLARELNLEREINNIGGLTAERYQAAIDMKRQAQNVKEQAYRSEFQSGYGARMALMRQSRAAGTRSRFGQYTIEGQQAMLLGQGTPYSNEEVAGMLSTLGNVAGGRYTGFGNRGLAASMLSMQYGGLGNAAGQFGVASGYGPGMGFMGAATQGMSMYGARGLVDVAAGGQVMDTFQQAQTSGDFFTNGQQGIQGMMAATAMFGGDLRAARGLTSGYQGLAAYRAGTTDPLQLAINTAAAAEVDPRLYVREAYMNMSPVQMMDLLRKIDSNQIKSDGDLPPELREQGVTVQGLKAYAAKTGRHLFARFMTKEAAPEIAAAVDSYRKTGFKGMVGMSPAALRQQFRRLGTALMRTNSKDFPTVDAAQSVLAQLAAGEAPELLPALTGGHVGDVAANSAERRIMKEAEDRTRFDTEQYYVGEKGKKELKLGTATATQLQGDVLVGLSQTIGVGGAQVKAALSDLSQALHDAASSIRGGTVYRAKGKSPTE